MFKTVNDMFYNSVENNKKLLSTYPADFWQEYRNNFDKYDKLFQRMFKSFRYFLQDYDDSVDDVTDNFIDDVYNHLMINHKKYEELYRVYVISDNDYSIIDNYRITETLDKATSSTASADYGARTDVDAITNRVVPYDSNTAVEANNSTNTMQKGLQHDALQNAGTESYTLHRAGNIGVQTGTDMINKHTTYWNTYNFYTMIFKEISKELLLV